MRGMQFERARSTAETAFDIPTRSLPALRIPVSWFVQPLFSTRPDGRSPENLRRQRSKLDDVMLLLTQHVTGDTGLNSAERALLSYSRTQEPGILPIWGFLSVNRKKTRVDVGGPREQPILRNGSSTLSASFPVLPPLSPASLS